MVSGSQCRVGFYEQRVLPRVIDRLCGSAAMHGLRRKAMDGLSGTIIELGFGSGPNIGLYPDEVTAVLAVEPSMGAREIAADRVAKSIIPIEFIGLDGASLPLDDASVDGALATFTLCTIDDLDTALAEVMRVVRPGGRFHFLEHGLAPDDRVRRWQYRLDPIEKRIAGGCRLTRDAAALVAAAGFHFDDVVSFYGQGPKPWSYFTWAQAIRPAEVAAGVDEQRQP